MEQQRADEILRRVLKLDTLPVAVSLLEDPSELHGEPLQMKLNNCQLISRARHGGMYSSGIPDRMVCSIGAACTGLVQTPEAFTDGTAALGKYAATREAGVRFSGTHTRPGTTGLPIKPYSSPPWEAVPFTPWPCWSTAIPPR